MLADHSCEIREKKKEEKPNEANVSRKVVRRIANAYVATQNLSNAKAEFGVVCKLIEGGAKAGAYRTDESGERHRALPDRV